MLLPEFCILLSKLSVVIQFQSKLEELCGRWQQYSDILSTTDQYMIDVVTPWLLQDSATHTKDNTNQQLHHAKVCNKK